MSKFEGFIRYLMYGEYEQKAQEKPLPQNDPKNSFYHRIMTEPLKPLTRKERNTAFRKAFKTSGLVIIALAISMTLSGWFRNMRQDSYLLAVGSDMDLLIQAHYDQEKRS